MEIYYYAAARVAAGCASETIESPPQTLGHLLDELNERHGGVTARGTSFANVLAMCSFLADGQRIEQTSTLTHVERLDVMPPFAGG